MFFFGLATFVLLSNFQMILALLIILTNIGGQAVQPL